MTDKNRDELANVDDVEIDALTDDDLEDVAGGRMSEGDCTCAISSRNCSNSGAAVY